MSYFYACPGCGDTKMPPPKGEKHPVPCRHCPKKDD